MNPDDWSTARARFDQAKSAIWNDGQIVTREGVRDYFRRNSWPHADQAYGDGMGRMKAAQSPPVVDMSYTPANAQVVSSVLWADKVGGRKGKCPASPLPDALPTEVEYDYPVAVFSDFHIPYHDEQFIDRAVDKALREGVKRFILAGDLTDNGQWNAKRGVGRQHDRSWQKDIDLARSVMGYLCANFPGGTLVNGEVNNNIVMFGNHDEWIINMTKGQMTADWLYAYLFPDMPVQWLSYHQVILHNMGDTFLIIHGEKFSHANPMGVVEQYALHRRRHVVIGHMHYAAQWQSGPYQLILNGGCFDRTKMTYIHRDPLPMRETQTGFTIIRGGRATLYAGRENWS
jgi:predicted phosphodiesterase